MLTLKVDRLWGVGDGDGQGGGKWGTAAIMSTLKFFIKKKTPKFIINIFLYLVRNHAINMT